jgi:uncharacterized protein YaaQ
MNIHDIALRIENPALLVSSDIPVLHELSKKYPYAQLISLLYLKALAKEQSLELEDALAKHAYKITDRERLYEVLNEKEEVNNVVQELYEIETDPVLVSLNTEVEPPISETKNLTDTSEITEDNQILENQLEETKQEDSLTNESVLEKLVEIQENKEKELDLDVISNAISGVFEREFEPERTTEKEKTSAIDIPSETIISLTTEKQEISIKGSRQSFSTWIKAGNKTVVAEKNENSVDKIIDTFIQEDPKISQPKKEFYSPIKQAKKSLDSENLQYTETLANILGVQGNYPKAILAYEQLCLTIPEKKTFFVQKIKELKEKLNS